MSRKADVAGDNKATPVVCLALDSLPLLQWQPGFTCS